jgi:hypothetical protein
MHAIIKDRNGYELARFTLGEFDTLDCDHYARMYAGMYGCDLEPSAPAAEIPDGCEDLSVTLTEDLDSVCCWTSQNYMIATE